MRYFEYFNVWPRDHRLRFIETFFFTYGKFWCLWIAKFWTVYSEERPKVRSWKCFTRTCTFLHIVCWSLVERNQWHGTNCVQSQDFFNLQDQNFFNVSSFIMWSANLKLNCYFQGKYYAFYLFLIFWRIAQDIATYRKWENLFLKQPLLTLLFPALWK